MVLFRRAFVGASVAWAVALPLAAFIAAQTRVSPGAYLVALSIYLTGKVVCHQLAARSFELWGKQMPVCARRTGIYLGGALAAVAASVIDRSSRAFALQPKWLLLAAAVPTAATLAFEWSTGITPSNWIRFAAGLPLGAAVAWTIVTLLEDQVN